MKKTLRPTTHTSGISPKNVKAKRFSSKEPGEMQRPTLPIDIENMPNMPPVIGKQNPDHMNFIFRFGIQSMDGTVPYSPMGKPRPGRIDFESREIIGALGNNAKRGL